MLLSVTMLVVGVPTRYAEVSTVCTGGPCLEDAEWMKPAGAGNLAALGLSVPAYAALSVGLLALGQVACMVLSALLAWRGGNDRAAAIFAVLLALQGNLAAPESSPVAGFNALLAVNELVQAASVMAFLFLFPTATWVPRWAGAYLAGWLAFNAAFRSWPSLPNAVFAVLDNAQWIITLLLAISAQLYRYFVLSNDRQRLQTRWMLATLVAVLAGTILLEATTPAPGSLSFLLSQFISNLINPLLFVSIVVAIWRHRLWDIDLIIRRTLIYSVLSLLLAGVYLGTVLVLQTVLRPLTGQRDSSLVTVLSTLAIAALFVPLRRRVQAFIDRRFYRRKYDAAHVAAEFAGRVRDEVELERLTQQLLDTVQTTLQPAHTSLWLRKTSR
jgi:hypothetical protein